MCRVTERPADYCQESRIILRKSLKNNSENVSKGTFMFLAAVVPQSGGKRFKTHTGVSLDEAQVAEYDWPMFVHHTNSSDWKQRSLHVQHDTPGMNSALYRVAQLVPLQKINSANYLILKRNVMTE